MKFYTILTHLTLFLLQNNLYSQVLTRGPYLQMGNQTAITIRWRSDIATDTKVRFGAASSNLNQSAVNGASVTEHEIRLTNLTPDTRYYYEIGSSTTKLQGDANNYFVTMPPLSTKRRIRVVGFGDSGNGSQNQRDVRDAFLNFRGTNPTDVMLLMGDNAYFTGSEQEYQDYFFNVYQGNLLKNCKLYPVAGNHDYGNTEANTELRESPVNYYDYFTMPKNAECGGTPSGTEAYYSFDYGNIHFVVLDSYGTEGGKKLYDTTSIQAQWLKADLAANTQKWTIAAMHHPPYTKGSHNSDTEGDLVLIRERVNPIFERFGVDIALFGHSHVFERSFLIKNHTGLEETFLSATHQVNASSGKYDGSPNSCPINLTSQKTKHGTVYVVAGSAGQVGGAASGYPHDAMFFSENQLGGVFYFEVEDNRLDAFFLKSDGTVGDKFTLMKDVSIKKTLTVLANQPTVLTASYFGNYNWTNGETSRAVTVSLPVGTHTYYVSDGFGCVKDTFVINSLAVIPIELTDFQVKASAQKTALITWKTVSERQNSHFLIERSTDGMHFETVEKQTGYPLSTKLNIYTFEDKKPLNGFNYYRLRQVDLDGMEMILGIRSILISDDKDFLQVIPNPSKVGKTRFYISDSVKSTSRIQVTDVLGRLVFERNVDNLMLSTDLPTGVYFAQLTEGGRVLSTQKFIVE